MERVSRPVNAPSSSLCLDRGNSDVLEAVSYRATASPFKAGLAETQGGQATEGDPDRKIDKVDFMIEPDPVLYMATKPSTMVYRASKERPVPVGALSYRVLAA